MKTLFKIENMKCGGCSSAVSEALAKIPEVEDAKVDLEQAQAEVTGDIDAGKIASMITELGYPATVISE